MNAKTLEAVKRHGESLLLAFPNCTEKDPVALCKKLRRIETAIAKPILDYTNGEYGMSIEQLDLATTKTMMRLELLLWKAQNGPQSAVEFAEAGLFINRDPRGYALKLDDKWTHTFNIKQRRLGKPTLYTDWGGYGILAPDLTA